MMMSSTCPHNMVNFRPPAAEIATLVWGTPANFSGFRAWLPYCIDVAERKPNKLCMMFAVSLAGTLYIHFRGLLTRNGILAGAKLTLRPPSLALSYIGSATAPHSSSGRQTNFAALSRGRHLYSAGRPSRWALAHILHSVLLRRCGFCRILGNCIIVYTTLFTITGIEKRKNTK